MEDNECLGWFPRYTPSKPMCNDVGCATQVWNDSQSPSAEDYAKVGASDSTSLPHPLKSCGNGFYVVDELPKGIIRTNISTGDADFKCLTEDTAQQIHKAFENLRKTIEKDFPMAFTKRKARKYYKPKFTL